MNRRAVGWAGAFVAACMLWPLQTSAEPVGKSIGSNIDATDPSTIQVVPRKIDPARIGDANYVVRVTDEEEANSRTALPCQNIAYHNGLVNGVPFFFAFGGNPDNCFDDCSLPPNSPNRFICAAQVKTFGSE